MHETNRNCTFPVKREVYFEKISLHVTSVNWHVVCKHPKQMQEGIPVCHILMCVATDDIWQIGIRACRRWHNSWPLLPLVWCVWVLMHRHESGINLQFTLSKKQTSIFPIMLNYSFNYRHLKYRHRHVWGHSAIFHPWNYLSSILFSPQTSYCLQQHTSNPTTLHRAL